MEKFRSFQRKTVNCFSFYYFIAKTKAGGGKMMENSPDDVRNDMIQEQQ